MQSESATAFIQEKVIFCPLANVGRTKKLRLSCQAQKRQSKKYGASENTQVGLGEGRCRGENCPGEKNSMLINGNRFPWLED